MRSRKAAYYSGQRTFEEHSMGKGDKRTFRGKVFKGSHGKSRPRKAKKPAKRPT
jgi:ribosomal small subunit protein bTHX